MQNLLSERARIAATLILASAYVLLTPFSSRLSEFAFPILLSVIAFVALLAILRRQWVDVGIAVIVGAFFGIVVPMVPALDTFTPIFRTAGILGFVFLSAVLWIGPLVRFFHTLAPIYKHRRHVGVTAFFLAWMHGSFILHAYFGLSWDAAWTAPFTVFGLSALFILLLLAITSWDRVQKISSQSTWIVAHTLAFLFYLYILYDFWRVSGTLLPQWQRVALAVFILFWIAANPALSPRWFKKVGGWKQVHVLVYVAYASVVTHVATGPLITAPAWMRAGFWVMIAATIALHTAGLARAFILHRKKSMRPFITHNGKRFYLLDDRASFVAEHGRRFDINGIDIAAFLHQDRVFAISNVCPHQGGPLCDGAIVDGYVVCPWHGYQFSTKNGTAPPPFHDSVPYYETFEQEGRVYVCLDVSTP
ncbi:Rieske 2Fe-2S domain-containing protein [Candidatus Uhrbacteria bacterium]|nr:Rieske 2Fe-2S domain-containing protein [Candidatus Uhrbacteria bacterium]